MQNASNDAAATQSREVDEDGATRPIGPSRSGGADPQEMQAGTVGQTLGRYVLLRPLGAGGMSVVWLAYDPELDRRVALKLMHPGGRRSTVGSGEQRLLREAQALARLSHANVVHVYDVGVVDDQVYLAMELLDGVTLKEWSATGPRHWADVLAVLLQAARGLAAAHVAGLVHLDFKPSNVIVANDGVVRVVDFGLAREPRRTGEPSRDAAPLPSVSTSGRLGEQLTEAGAVLGTPGYIAPELLTGGQAHAGADQFSFCVTLWEALYGERPFAGDDRVTLHRNVASGRVREPPVQVSVPGSLRRLLVRGLAVRPEDRHPDMDALIRALRACLQRRRPLRIAIAALAAAGGGALWAAWPRTPADPCADAGRPAAETWNSDRAAIARTAFQATALPYADAVSGSVERVLDSFTAQWTSIAHEACTATIVRGEQSNEVLALQDACLDRARGELSAVLDLYEQADEGVVEHALEAAVGLPELARCLDIESLRAEARAPLDPHDEVAIAELDLTLARARALADTGRLREASDLVVPAIDRARSIGHPPTIARTALVAGNIESSIGEARRAEALYTEALWAAESSGLDRLRLRALIDLSYVVGHLLRELERGTWYAETGARVLERVGAGDETRMQLLVNRGVLASDRADFDEALRLFSDALDAQEHLDTPAENRSTVLGNLGSVHYERGEFELALSYYERSLALDRDLLGSGHPRVANTLTNCANAEQALGQFDEALAHHEQAIAVLERAGADRGPAHALGLNNVGVVLSSMQRWAAAADYYDRARATLEVASPDHPILDIVLLNHAETQLHTGRVEQALSEYERASVRLQAAFGPRHPYTAAALAGVGMAHLELGHLGQARAQLEDALALHDEVGGDAVQRAETQTALARVLDRGTPSDRRRARRLALDASAVLAQNGARAAPALARAERVLAATSDDVTER